MKKIYNEELCTGCAACYNACPKHCISMQQNAEGFYVPIIDEEMCISCGKCERVCFIRKNEKSLSNYTSKAFAVWNNNDVVRLKSSSGGFFSVIAEWVIKNNGVVFGAAYNEEWYVSHIEIQDLCGIEKMRGSKYVQSYIGDSYKRVENYLDNKRLVLFTGTPCQIQGLKSYLKKDYEKLVCLDLICHGVPSEIVWKKFLNKQCEESEIENVFFRDKTYSWKNYDFVIKKKTGEEIRLKRINNNYMEGFVRNLFLRKSCSNCSAKGVERESDLTLADLWGSQQICPELDDDKGINLVICHTPKGKKILEMLKEEIFIQEIDLQKAISYNISAVLSSIAHEKREYFFKIVKRKDVDKAIEKCLYGGKISRVKQKIYNRIFK